MKNTPVSKLPNGLKGNLVMDSPKFTTPSSKGNYIGCKVINKFILIIILNLSNNTARSRRPDNPQSSTVLAPYGSCIVLNCTS